ncbi:T-cell-specific guanine nucleotide triphosphate-binding protein [Seminavis robusta]|uniref:T-cell-specific guanine nucleotide triphosphate-binding protein n=1 Tax=Seminavis robusta TaxID=568900 RepID=A0A9N8E5Y6_9STRA|nr:T-cell-specific guanine nucleotide triphosphate-binding protein [Seminavis robusta]|eukprot:Sro577_g169670.1 T-cell-specific guanine nucleotide triphosphate-binding protein (324) ;mRNA; r:20447-21418
MPGNRENQQAARHENQQAERELVPDRFWLTRSARPEIIGEPKPWSFNVAICGNSGCGKSTGINTLLDPYHEDAQEQAPTGNTETTMEPRLYTINCPQMLNLLRLAFGGPNDGTESWWNRAQRRSQAWLLQRGVSLVGGDPFCLNLVDHPGAGTRSIPAQTYIIDYGLSHYDFVVLVTAGRLTEAEQDVFDECVANRIPVAVVRAKFDVDLSSENKKPMCRRKTEEEVKKSILDYFEQVNVRPVYLLDMMRFESHDFARCFRHIVRAALHGRDGRPENERDNAALDPYTEETDEDWEDLEAIVDALVVVEGQSGHAVNGENVEE